MRSFAQKAPKLTSDMLRRPPVAQNAAISPTQQLQRRVGNQALQRMLQAHAGKAKEDAAARDATLRIQPKLTINTPGDAHEQEADRVAEQVMRMAEPSGHSNAFAGISSHAMTPAARVQTKSTQAGDSGGAAAPPIVHDVLRSPGQPLDAATRAFMEPRFGQDFGHVRVHTDPKAAESAAAINARAYTVGYNVVFDGGKFAPGTMEGKQLLAHELTHVSQNAQGAVQRQPANPAAGFAIAKYLDETIVGTLENKTKHEFKVEAGAGWFGTKLSFMLKAGEKKGGKNNPAKGPNGEKLTDMDFVWPTKDTPINTIPFGKFKIGFNDAVLSPDAKNAKYSIITHYSDFTPNLNE